MHSRSTISISSSSNSSDCASPDLMPPQVIASDALWAATSTDFSGCPQRANVTRYQFIRHLLQRDRCPRRPQLIERPEQRLHGHAEPLCLALALAQRDLFNLPNALTNQAEGLRNLL